MKCPKCGAPIGKSVYHTTLDTLTPCDGGKAEAAAKPDTDAEPKKPARKRATKK